MKKETKRRIKYYQEALPGLKERVAAAGMMLLIAAAITVTATYAWVTLSRAPAISGVNTTVTSNGNLEIALSPADGTQPAEFDVDESAPKSTDVTVSNLQWGNLINLSDVSYGMDELVLRPTQLNTASLKFSPLWGAVYGTDGRISTLDSNYTFAKWDTTGNEFIASKDYGVRAIASYVLKTSEGTSVVYNEMAEAVNKAHREVNTAYAEVADAIPGMSEILSTYIQGQVPESMGGGAQDPFTSAQLGNTYKTYTAIYDAMTEHKEALVALANFQRYVYSVNNAVAYEEITWDELVAGKAKYNTSSTETASKDGVISLVGLTQFISDYGVVETDKEYVKLYYEETQTGARTVYWDTGGVSGYQIQDMVSRLIDYSNMTVVIEGVETTFSQITSDVSGYATKLLGMNGQHTNAYVRSGIVKRFEQAAVDESYRLQGQTNGAVVTVKVKATVVVSVNITLYGDCYTKASGSSSFMNDYTAAVGNPLEGKDAVAEDTYGMAVDFWVRTNAESTYLTLEGALVSDESGEIYSYDGVNRVWGSTNTANLTTNSTTQGSGSCYIYYADTPEDMMRSLQLLESMKVAFVDSDGNMMALGSMDTDNYYAVNGRITVPIRIDTNSGVNYTYVDEYNAEQTGVALTRLVSDEPERITAIIYLDGTYLSNEDVLAAAEIQGQMNIQFGSSENLSTVGDNKLLVAERVVTASVSKTSMNFDEAISAADLTTGVTVKVQGTSPNTVTAFFMRAINSTQGQREATMTFTKQTEDTWGAEYAFTAPGTYYLRYVRLDGVDYALENPPMVEVEGFAVKSVKWNESSDEVTIYTPENYYKETVYIEFASSDADAMPGAVQARFVREDGNSIVINTKYNSTKKAWEGEGTFSVSGTYSLEYLVLDNHYYDISESGFIKTLHLSLGMKTQVYNNGSTTNDLYDAEAEAGTYAKNVGVKIYDNANKEITALEGARLRYSLGGSATNTVDTDLTWNEDAGWYTGTLPIVRPGRYTYLEVNLNGSSLTKAIDSPTYMVISPDPPVYDTSSASTYYSEVQFAPLTNDAYIGPIVIDNSSSATLAATVHNDVTGEDYTITMSNVQNVPGTMYYDNGKWYIKLPTYTLDLDSNGDPVANAVYTQEGTWSVTEIYVWDCYDSDSQYRDQENPIVWTSADTDFSKLSTTVSSSININMEPGTTELGTLDTEFMTDHYVADLGMGVTIVDDSGRVIPDSKISDIELSVSYTANTDAATYGYVVTRSENYGIKLNSQDDSTGRWGVSDETAYNWQYVGQYKVNSLTVTMSNGSTLVYTSGQHGVPTEYVVKSQAPSADNLRVKTLSQPKTVFGKTNDVVDGTFLQNINPSISLALELVYEDAAGSIKTANYARVDGVSVSLKGTYNGGSSDNGGYTWTGTSSYETFDMTLSNTNTGTYTFETGSTILLAGTYELEGTITVGDDTNDIGELNDIEVFSKKPTVKVTGVNPDTNASYQMNLNAGENSQYYANAQLTDVQNYYSDYLANVYIKAVNDSSTYELVDYTLPKVSLTLSNMGTTFANAVLTVPNGSNTSGSNAFTFSSGGLTQTTEIGMIGTDTFQVQTGTVPIIGTPIYDDVEYETRYWTGEQTITALQVTDASGTVYTVSLSDGVVIRELNEAMPSISYVAATGYDFTVPETEVSEDGAAFKVTLPTSIGTETKTYEETDESVEWVTTGTVTSNLMYYKEGNIEQSKSGNCTTTYTSKCNFTYYLYTRTQTTQEKTSATTKYSGVYGLTGWKIGNITYAPGETITVSGTYTAIPVIGVIGTPTVLETTTKTRVRITTSDASNGTATGVGTATSESTYPNAAAKATYNDTGVKPDGYDWFDASQPTVDGHLVTDTVEEYDK